MNYNYIAPYYDILSRLAFCNRQQMAHDLILNYLEPHQKILWIGGGSGWLLKKIDALNIPIEIDFIEYSEVMLNQAKKITLTHININFIHADAFNYLFDTTYDGIITAFFFDHFKEDECQKLFYTLNQHLKPDGLWFYIDFVENQTYFQQIITQSMILFFRIVANSRNDKFPKILWLFENYKLLESKNYFGNYMTSRVYKNKKDLN